MSWKNVYATGKMLINGQYREIEGHLYKRLSLCGDAGDIFDLLVELNDTLFAGMIQQIWNLSMKLLRITTSARS